MGSDRLTDESVQDTHGRLKQCIEGQQGVQVAEEKVEDFEARKGVRGDEQQLLQVCLPDKGVLYGFFFFLGASSHLLERMGFLGFKRK